MAMPATVADLEGLSGSIRGEVQLLATQIRAENNAAVEALRAEYRTGWQELNDRALQEISAQREALERQ